MRFITKWTSTCMDINHDYTVLFWPIEFLPLLILLESLRCSYWFRNTVYHLIKHRRFVISLQKTRTDVADLRGSTTVVKEEDKAKTWRKTRIRWAKKRNISVLASHRVKVKHSSPCFRRIITNESFHLRKCKICIILSSYLCLMVSHRMHRYLIILNFILLWKSLIFERTLLVNGSC